MRSFIAELQRRNFLRTAAFYAAGGWVLVQVATQVFPFFDIPNWVVRLVVVAIILGFPVTMAFSWFYELTPQGLKLESELTPSESANRGGGRKLDRWIIALLLLAVVLLVADRVAPHQPAPAAQAAAPAATLAPPDKSIAVLPFNNLSDDKANAYFAQGMQDEILTRLAKIGALKVISRTSSQQYSSGASNLPEIARQLGVGTVLEGSVQKLGDRVHINMQLIRAATDEHLWAESYDRRLDDVFAVEGEVAQAVAQALQARLSGGEQQAIAARPTSNAVAYDAYLRGRGHELRAFNVFTLELLRQTESDYAEAVRLDPEFALAWARLSIVKSYIYANVFDRSAAFRAQAKEAADTALRLRPEMGEAYLAQGYYRYRVLEDYAGGLEAFNQALERLPNSAEALAAIGYIERRQGKWQESTAHLEQASTLDPRNTAMLAGLALNYAALRQYSQALEVSDRALAVAPQDPDLISGKAGLFQQSGNLDAARRLLDSVPAQSASSNFYFVKFQQLLLERRYDEAVEQFKLFTASPTPPAGVNLPAMHLLLGFTLISANQRAAAEQPCRLAQEELKPMRKTEADDAVIGGLLAGTYSCLGQHDTALRYARHAVELNANDALTRPQIENVLALIEMGAGHADAALDLLQRLLQEPNGLAVENVRLNPFWDPLRGNPRFQQLVGVGPAK